MIHAALDTFIPFVFFFSRFSGRFKKTPRSIQGNAHFPEFWNAGCEDCVCSEQDPAEFPVQEKGQSGGTDTSERRSVPSRKTFQVTRDHDTVLEYADLFTLTLRNDDVQEYDAMRDEILLSMTKIPPDEVLESLHKLRIRESDQLKTVLEMYDMEIHQQISMPDYQKLTTMVKRSIDQKLRLRNLTPQMR